MERHTLQNQYDNNFSKRTLRNPTTAVLEVAKKITRKIGLGIYVSVYNICKAVKLN